jgi:Potassium-transporting ATPase A subunit
MWGLTVKNFVSAAVGLAIMVALIRGLARRSAQAIGNFWVDGEARRLNQEVATKTKGPSTLSQANRVQDIVGQGRKQS